VDRQEIEAALRDVSEELARRGVNARIYVVGGAAMSLAFHARLSTADVDADVYPADDVLDVAREVGVKRELPENWLNDSAKQFIPAFKDPEWRPVFRLGGVEIATADERAMLAMKMRASRGSRDVEDIKFLLGKCHITNESDALALYEDYFPEDPLPERARPLLRGALAEVGSPTPPDERGGSRCPPVPQPLGTAKGYPPAHLDRPGTN
jgi:hypothetical protein